MTVFTVIDDEDKPNSSFDGDMNIYTLMRTSKVTNDDTAINLLNTQTTKEKEPNSADKYTGDLNRFINRSCDLDKRNMNNLSKQSHFNSNFSVFLMIF